MTSKAEAIADALYDALTAVEMSAVPAAQVFRDLNGALEASALPAIAVETGDEEAPQRVVTSAVERAVEVRMTVFGQTSFGAVDAALCEAYGRVMADPTLGGLAFDWDEGTTRRERESGARQLVAVSKSWRFVYRTAENSLEA